MKYVCVVCHQEAFHNEKLDIHFCRDHGMTAEPDLPGLTRANFESVEFVRQKMTK